jgi:hypothetical protein
MQAVKVVSNVNCKKCVRIMRRKINAMAHDGKSSSLAGGPGNHYEGGHPPGAALIRGFGE